LIDCTTVLLGLLLLVAKIMMMMMMMGKYGVTPHDYSDDLTSRHLTWRPERLHQISTSSPSRAWLIDVTRHAPRACAFKYVSGVACFYERGKIGMHCGTARLLSMPKTSSGVSTSIVNCRILMLYA